MSYLEMAKEVSGRKGFGKCYERNERNERNSARTPEPDSLVADSLERINASVPAEVAISDWSAFDRFTALADEARDRGDIPALRQALSDMERIAKQQVADFRPLVVYDWDDEPVTKPEPDTTPWCPRYKHPRAWRSIYGDHLICATCHPPVSETRVAEWIG